MGGLVVGARGRKGREGSGMIGLELAGSHYHLTLSLVATNKHLSCGPAQVHDKPQQRATETRPGWPCASEPFGACMFLEV